MGRWLSSMTSSVPQAGGPYLHAQHRLATTPSATGPLEAKRRKAEGKCFLLGYRCMTVGLGSSHISRAHKYPPFWDGCSLGSSPT